MWIVTWVSEALGLKKFLGTATIIAGVLVITSAAVAWLRDDATRDCNVQWELKVAKANQKLFDDIAMKAVLLQEVQEKLRVEKEAKEAALDQYRTALEKQRETIPLSKACTECRIPNERLWLRRATGSGTPDRSKSGPGS